MIRIPKQLFIDVFVGAIAFWLMFVAITPVQVRHDMAKSIIGDLDDRIVQSGFISDRRLHVIGWKFGLCEYPLELQLLEAGDYD